MGEVIYVIQDRVEAVCKDEAARLMTDDGDHTTGKEYEAKRHKHR